MARRIAPVAAALALFACVSGVHAQPPTPVTSSIPGETAEEFATRMQWFRDAKFGVFICWGPCSIAEGEIGWSRWGPRPGIGDATGGVPLQVYDNLYKKFNPTRFDAPEWAKLIRDSGAKYVIFLTRHHDGFSMCDSKLSDYKVTNSPFGRDVTGELARALQDAGIRIFWYYSQPDWHHPDYRTANHQRYVAYLHGQIRELCTNYGKIDGLWFDGLGGSAEDWDAPRLFEMIHSLQPGAIINNRAGLPGDFDTPEQTLGSYQLERPWESCITMSTQWSWGGVNAPVKSLKECLHLLIRCAGGGGNLALDTGPMPDGRIDPRQADNYRRMGAWLHLYGDSIYATTGGPYKPAKWGCSTRRGDTVYLHILEWPVDGEFMLPPLSARIVGYRALTGGGPVVRRTEKGLLIRLSPMARNENDTIIALKLDRPAADLAPISALAQGALTIGQPASASGIWSAEYAAEKAFDGDEATRWGAEPGSHSGWLEMDLGAAATFDKAVILEAPWDRVRDFRIEWRDGDAWRTCAEGTTLGNVALRFPPVTAQHVRLNVLSATGVPTLWEFVLYPPEVPLPALDLPLRSLSE